MNVQNVSRAVQRGFSLLELMVVVAIIGILAVVLAPYIKGSTAGTKAAALLEVAEKANASLNQLAQSCGISAAVTGNPLPDTGKTLADVLFGGATNVAPAYQTCYSQSQVKAMTDSSQPGSIAGNYNVVGFGVTFAGGGNAPLQVAYASVPDEVTLLMARRFSPNLAALAASDTTGSVIQYSTATSGLRTVTVFKQ